MDNKPPSPKRRSVVLSDNQGDNSHTVAKYYNSLKVVSKFDKKRSKIYYMRNFNNCIKSILLGSFTNKARGNDRSLTVLDLACGKGGDLLKWKKANITKLVCTDIAKVALEAAERRFSIMKYTNCTSEFFTCDSAREDLKTKFNESDIKFDLTSCQFAIHYSFESKEQAERMVKNACQSIKEGGYFIGTTVNSDELRKRLDASESCVFGNKIYSVKFDSKEPFTDFGCRYVFKLDDVVDCPEFVLQKDVFVEICRQNGMRLIEWTTFHDVFWKNAKHRETYELMKRMQALETYHSNHERNHLSSEQYGDYNHAQEECVRLCAKKPQTSPVVATLSKTEWEVASLYVTFAFVKDSKSTKSSPESKDETRRRDRIPLIHL